MYTIQKWARNLCTKILDIKCNSTISECPGTYWWPWLSSAVWLVRCYCTSQILFLSYCEKWNNLLYYTILLLDMRVFQGYAWVLSKGEWHFVTWACPLGSNCSWFSGVYYCGKSLSLVCLVFAGHSSKTSWCSCHSNRTGEDDALSKKKQKKQEYCRSFFPYLTSPWRRGILYCIYDYVRLLCSQPIRNPDTCIKSANKAYQNLVLVSFTVCLHVCIAEGSTLQPIWSQIHEIALVTKTSVAVTKLWLCFTQKSSPDGKCN